MELKDRDWKAFYIGGEKGIFSLRASKSGIDKNKLIDSGEKKVPYITRSDLHNGYSLFISAKQNTKFNVDEGNVITIGLDTQTVFYQPHAFYTGQNIQVISNNHLNLFSSLFVCRLLKLQLKKFNWGGNGATLGRLAKTKILLPVTKDNQPDYKFMGDYIKEIMKSKRETYAQFLREQIKKETKIRELEPLESKQWKAFKLQEIFEILPGKRLESENQISGNRPFIGASDSNNGITNFVSNSNQSLDRNVLGINYNGSVCEGFYHPYECIFSDDVKRLHLKETKDSRNILLLFSTLIQQQKNKYRYAYKFNTERMKKQYIMLPVNDKGNPDYSYMEAYVHNIISRKHNEYIDYVASL